MIHITKELAAKLETAESLNQVSYVETHQQLFDDSYTAFEKIGTGYAIFAGVDSPLTQCFGLGFDGEASEAQVIALEDFFWRHGAPVNIEVSHLSDLSLSRLLIERGYKIIEYSNVLVRRLDASETFTYTSGKDVRRVFEDEVDAVAETIARGFLETDEIPQSFIDLFHVFLRQPNGACFGAFSEGKAVGGGAFYIKDDIAALGGAATLVEYRKQGVQSDLLRKRLEYGVSQNCTLAMVTTVPGSNSQHNVEKRGFQVAYARTKFFKERPS